MWGVFKFLADRFHHDNPDRQILYPKVASDGDAGDIDADGGYFEVWASRMFLHQDRDWFHGQYPTVQSFFTFEFGSGGGSPIKIAHAAGPTQLQEVGENRLGRVIQMNHLLCGLVPYRGGSVQMEVALIATREDDDIKRLLGVVGDFSSLVTVPQLSTVLDVATKVADGVEKLAGADGNKLATGFEGTFVGSNDDSPSGHSLRNSFFLAVNAPLSNFDEKQLSFSDGRLLYNNEPFEDADWILLEIKTHKNRPDPVGTLSAIEDPLNDAIRGLASVTNGDTTASDVLYHSAIVAALISDDLIQADKKIAVDELGRRYEEAKIAIVLKHGAGGGGGGGGSAEALDDALLKSAKEGIPDEDPLGAIELPELKELLRV